MRFMVLDHLGSLFYILSQPANAQTSSSKPAKRKLQLVNNFSDTSSDESIPPTQKRRALFIAQKHKTKQF